MKRYWIETYGCQMNKAESGSLELQLQESGWQPAGDLSEAELVVLNTCSVRKTAEERIWGRLGFFKAEKSRASRNGRPLRLVLMGCMGERLKEQMLSQAPHLDILVGTFQKHRLIDLLETQEGNKEAHRALTGVEEYRFFQNHTPDSFQAFVPIMHGCNNYCTYCIVPYVRGPEVSRSPESILAEISRLQSSESRALDITLLGQNVNSYRYPIAGNGSILTFPGLLRLIIPNLKRRTWLRFLTSHPKDMSDELIQLIGTERTLCRHIHLPVQHGSDWILEAMGRGYSRDHFLRLVERIRKVIPGVSLTTDILVGFPGETQADYQLTLELMEQVQFDDAFTYRYNPREGTKAFALGDDVPDNVKQERLSEVIRLQRQISRRRKLAKIGREVEVLVESISKKDSEELLARTESDEMVVFPGSADKIGRFTRIALSSLKGGTFWGKETDGKCLGN